MNYLMTRKFARWAKKEGIPAQTLVKSIIGVAQGHFEASLGGHIYKKRVARPGQGKSGGYRTLICFKQNDRAIFVHGFSKSSRDNINNRELKALKELAAILLAMDEKELQKAKDAGAFVEVNNG